MGIGSGLASHSVQAIHNASPHNPAGQTEAGPEEDRVSVLVTDAGLERRWAAVRFMSPPRLGRFPRDAASRSSRPRCNASKLPKDSMSAKRMQRQHQSASATNPTHL
jgi:hypothetical protein